jgi:hypothetical protein
MRFRARLDRLERLHGGAGRCPGCGLGPADIRFVVLPGTGPTRPDSPPRCAVCGGPRGMEHVYEGDFPPAIAGAGPTRP